MKFNLFYYLFLYPPITKYQISCKTKLSYIFNPKTRLKNLSPKKPKPIKRKLINLKKSEKTHINTKVNNEKTKNTIKQPPAKLDRDHLTSQIKSPKIINKTDQSLSSSSTCHAISMDIPNPLPQFLSVFHRSR